MDTPSMLTLVSCEYQGVSAGRFGFYKFNFRVTMRLNGNIQVCVCVCVCSPTLFRPKWNCFQLNKLIMEYYSFVVSVAWLCLCPEHAVQDVGACGPDGEEPLQRPGLCGDPAHHRGRQEAAPPGQPPPGTLPRGQPHQPHAPPPPTSCPSPNAMPLPQRLLIFVSSFLHPQLGSKSSGGSSYCKYLDTHEQTHTVTSVVEC